MRVRAAFAAMIFLMGFQFATGTSGSDQIARSGDSSLRKVVGNKTIVVEFHTFIAKTSDPWFPPEFEGYNELSFVQHIRITVDGKTIWVPRSAYLDLFDAHAAAILFEQDLFVLSIAGADGGDAYQVHVYFDSKRVIRRAFYGLEFSTKKPSEETTYGPPQVIN
jgi:hypothetical protein